VTPLGDLLHLIGRYGYLVVFFGVMLESHLVEGRQDYTPGRNPVYGQSITDACISLEQTERLLEQFATAQQARGVKAA
jgi:3-deoxy-7-phosphoheptulonate synthase